MSPTKKTVTNKNFFEVVPNEAVIPVNPAKGHLVPFSENFVDSDNLLSNLAYAINENFPVLLTGETGTGKTSAIRYLASKTNNNFRRLNLNGQTTVDEFVGKIMINNEGTYWVDGVLTEALRHGYWLVLDELNAALPEVLFVLQSLMDDDRYIVLSDKDDKEIVRPHENFRLFATMNPSEGYSGTKELNKAFLSRFRMVLHVDYPSREDEISIITERTGAQKSEVSTIVDIARDLRKTHSEGEMDFVLSTRDLLAWAGNNKFFGDWAKSASATFLNKCNEDDRSAIEKILKLNFKTVLGTVKKESEIINMALLRVENEFSIFGLPNEMVQAGAEIRIVRITEVQGKTMAILKVEKTPQGATNTPGIKYLMKGATNTVQVSALVGNTSIIQS